jgi:hypothetical protein
LRTVPAGTARTTRSTTGLCAKAHRVQASGDRWELAEDAGVTCVRLSWWLIRTGPGAWLTTFLGTGRSNLPAASLRRRLAYLQFEAERIGAPGR